MGRRKFRLAWIEDHNARKASLRKRREGLKKIVQELSVLCGVDAGIIVFSPGEQQSIVWPEFQAIWDIFNRYMDIPDMYRDLNGRNTEVNLQKLLGKLYEMVIKLRSRNDTAALSLLSYQIEQGSREAASLEMNELNAMLAWAPEKLAEINKFLEEAGDAEVDGLASNQVGEADVFNDQDPALDSWFVNMMKETNNVARNSGAGVNVGSNNPNPDYLQAAGGADATLDDQDRDSWYLNLMSQRNIVAQSSAVVAGVNIGSGTNNSDQASQAAGTDATINDPAPAWFLSIVNHSNNVAGSSTGAGQGLNVNVISQAPAYEYVGTLNTPHSELMNSSANVAGSSTQGSGGTGAQGPKEWEEFEEGLDCVADLFEEYMKSLSLSKP